MGVVALAVVAVVVAECARLHPRCTQQRGPSSIPPSPTKQASRSPTAPRYRRRSYSIVACASAVGCTILAPLLGCSAQRRALTCAHMRSRFKLATAQRPYHGRLFLPSHLPNPFPQICSTRSLTRKYFPALEAALESELRPRIDGGPPAHGKLSTRGGTLLSVRDDCCRCLYRCFSLCRKLEELLHLRGYSARAVEQEMGLALVLARMVRPAGASSPPRAPRQRI